MAKRVIVLKYYKNPDSFITHRPGMIAECWEKKQGLHDAMKAKTIDNFDIIEGFDITVGMVKVIDFKK